ncbi:MAG: type I-B CRISPR-associated protein Cas5 [Firmicutes bacterium HGW-Firmicutes-7]|nr:MAG: type I-B CRISPR-associated protein Cas5 [Firmicutes bacterium HGW-Firmicutes-7]
MKCVCFKLKGDYGHFRPYYTTSSPTTYSLMPPTSIFGLIGAILGLEKIENSYYQVLIKAGLRVGIGVITPVKKVSMSTNLINTKGNYWVPTGRNTSGVRTPTKYEYVVGQEYLIFAAMEDERLLEELAIRLEEHCFAYSISLGLSGLIADAELICFEEVQKVEKEEYQEVDSAVNIQESGQKIQIHISPDIQYCRERYVKQFGKNRVPLDYVDVLFSANGRKIKVKCKKVYQMQDYIFTFLNE